MPTLSSTQQMGEMEVRDTEHGDLHKLLGAKKMEVAETHCWVTSQCLFPSKRDLGPPLSVGQVGDCANGKI